MTFSTRHADIIALVSVTIFIVISIESENYKIEYIISILLIILFSTFLSYINLSRSGGVIKSAPLRVEHIFFYIFPIIFTIFSISHTLGIFDFNLRSWGMGAASSVPIYIRSVMR